MEEWKTGVLSVGLAMLGLDLVLDMPFWLKIIWMEGAGFIGSRLDRVSRIQLVACCRMPDAVGVLVRCGISLFSSSRGV